jgi:septum formation protein
MAATDPHIYLASASPRRGQLLDQLGVRYCVVPQSVDETPHPGEASALFVERLALEKARAGWADVQGARVPVLGADTCIVADGAILGKPRDREHGLALLASLAGRTHQVLSAVALVQGGREAVRLSASRVTLRPMSAGEREAYWASGEPVDKAGAYAIQGKGAVLVSHLEGSYSGVMGLPLFETAQLLEQFGIAIL